MGKKSESLRTKLRRGIASLLVMLMIFSIIPDGAMFAFASDNSDEEAMQGENLILKDEEVEETEEENNLEEEDEVDTNSDITDRETENQDDEEQLNEDSDLDNLDDEEQEIVSENETEEEIVISEDLVEEKNVLDIEIDPNKAENPEKYYLVGYDKDGEELEDNYDNLSSAITAIYEKCDLSNPDDFCIYNKSNNVSMHIEDGGNT